MEKETGQVRADPDDSLSTITKTKAIVDMARIATLDSQIKQRAGKKRVIDILI